MRLYAVLNFQDIIVYLFPTLIFVLVFVLALSYAHFRTKRSEEKGNRVYHRFPEEIEERHGPFPIVLVLTIAGAIVWGFLYILVIGLLGVKI
jgi:hypothetical protein